MMKHALTGMLLVAFGILPGPEDFKPYPGARSEPWFERYKRQAQDDLKESSPRAQLEMWITGDTFEKVVEFYKASGKERPEFTRSLAAMLSGKAGRPVQATHVIFDGAESPVDSKYYVAIQRPVIARFEPLEVHDVTAISLFRAK